MTDAQPTLEEHIRATVDTALKRFAGQPYTENLRRSIAEALFNALRYEIVSDPSNNTAETLAKGLLIADVSLFGYAPIRIEAQGPAPRQGRPEQPPQPQQEPTRETEMAKAPLEKPPPVPTTQTRDKLAHKRKTAPAPKSEGQS